MGFIIATTLRSWQLNSSKDKALAKTDKKTTEPLLIKTHSIVLLDNANQGLN